MSSSPPLLDYAPPPGGVRGRQVVKAFATLIIFAVIGAGLGTAVDKLVFRPMYAAHGDIKLRLAGSPVDCPSIIPQQWQLSSIVTTALSAARRADPAGQSLPSAPPEAIGHASLKAIAQTNLVDVCYTAHDPAAAACMTTAILNVCVATPATDRSGTKLLAQIETVAVAPDRP